MVEFLETITGEDFTYETGKKYVALYDLKEENLKGKVFVRQPNSPKKRNWWTEFEEKCIGETFRLVPDSELDLFERMEEERLLQL